MTGSGEDFRTNKCGHNFPPKECPYLACGYREALERVAKIEAALRAVLSVRRGSSGRLILEREDELAARAALEE